MEEMSVNFNGVIDKILVWAISGIFGFLIYNVWQVTIAVEKLVLNELKIESAVGAIQTDLTAIRLSQVNREMIDEIKGKVNYLEQGVLSRKHIQWNLTDMQKFANDLKQQNPALDMPVINRIIPE